MKMIILFQWFAVILLTACQSAGPIDNPNNSKNSFQWAGVYIGTIPAAEEPDVVEITLYPDETYRVMYQYSDRENTIYIKTGKFKWHKSGNGIMLDTNDIPSYYWVYENKLTFIIQKFSPVTGGFAESYVLYKQ